MTDPREPFDVTGRVDFGTRVSSGFGLQAAGVLSCALPPFVDLAQGSDAVSRSIALRYVARKKPMVDGGHTENESAGI